MPQDNNTKELSWWEKAFLAFLTYDRIKSRLILNQVPVHGDVLAILQELSPFFTDEAKKSIAEATALWEKNVRDMTKEQLEYQKELIRQRLADLRSEVAPYSAYPGEGGEILRDILTVTHQETLARIDAYNKRQEYLHGLQDAKDSSLTDRDEADRRKLKKAELPPIDVWGTMPTPEYTPVMDSASLFGGAISPGKPGSVPESAVGQLVVGEIGKTFDVLDKELQAFHSAFRSGMQAVGDGIEQWIGGEFRKTFGEANSLLEIFFVNFSNHLAQIAVRSGLNALLAGIGIPLPSGRIGSSPFADSSLVRQAAAFNLRKAEGYSLQNFQLTTKIKGSDLYIVLEKGKQNLLGRSMR